MKNRFSTIKHNQKQIRYFEKTVKQTMLPLDTHYNRCQAEAVIHFGELQPGEKVLEVGCGMGRHIFYLAEHGLQVEGLELTPGLVEQLQVHNQGRYNIPIHCCDILDAPDPLRERYDAIIGFFVLHHVHDLQRAFEKIVSLLKPGGRLIFMEPNPYNILYFLQIFFTPGMSWAEEKGLMQMRRNILFPIMKQTGLVQLTQQNRGFFPRFLSNIRAFGWAEERLEKFKLFEPIIPFQMFRGDKSK